MTQLARLEKLDLRWVTTLEMPAWLSELETGGCAVYRCKRPEMSGLRSLLAASAAHNLDTGTAPPGCGVQEIMTLHIDAGMLLLCAISAGAQQAFEPPPGTNLPVRLGHELAAGKSKAGAHFEVRTTQPVPIAPHRSLPRNTEIDGTVITSSTAAKGQPGILTLHLDTIRIHGQSVPIRTRALAAANFTQVLETGELCSGPDDMANPDPANWTTCQVGGDQVVRSGWHGPVIDSVTHTVGFANFGGVYGFPADPNGLPEALGVFSTTASGLYGYSSGSTMHSQAGSITVSSPGKVILHGDDNLLLQTE